MWVSDFWAADFWAADFWNGLGAGGGISTQNVLYVRSTRKGRSF